MSLLALIAASGSPEPPAHEWPPQFGPTELVVPLGPPGSWDATDANNPNVLFDPASQRWFISYTGHLHQNTGNGNIDEEQKVGYAWSNTLDGPWVKDPANPIFAETNPSSYSMNGGQVQLPNGTWLQAYKGDRAIRFATSPDLYNWTVLPTNINQNNSNDAFLRMKPDGRVECYVAQTNDGTDPYGRTLIRNCRRYISSDNGLTWVMDPDVFAYAPSFVNDGPGWGEFSVWHQPGYEDERMLLLGDANLPGLANWQARANVMGRTRDGGVTWDWHVVNTPGPPGSWYSVSVFDTFPVIHGGKFYLFFAGSDTPTSLLDGDIQLGVRVADWYDAWMTP